MFSTSFKVTGFARFPERPIPLFPLAMPDAVTFCSTGASTMVFQAWHEGHCPVHLDDSYPHSEQKKAVIFFFPAINLSSFFP